jgi:CRP/FNR family cyclic AMP-dependent transcriptional regulator
MVQIEGLDRLMREHPFFAGMDPQARQIIAGCAANERYSIGEYLFHEGESADKFYLIRHGSIALEIRIPGRAPLIIDTVQDGEVMGWSWCTPPYAWTLDARATRLTRVVSLDAKCLRGKIEDDRTLGYELYKRFIPVMADRLAASRLRLIDMYGAPTSQE